MPLERESEEVIRSLLKAATAHKGQGNWDKAVQSLRQANAIARAHGECLDTKSRLRLPKYLAHAGLRDRAWAEFSVVLEEICGAGRDEGAISIKLAEVYREMARFLRSEGRVKDAFMNELRSLHFWGRSRCLSYKNESDRAIAFRAAESQDEVLKRLQRRNGELASEIAAEYLKELHGILSDDGIEEFLDENLSDNELLTLKPELTALFQGEVKSLPDFDLTGLIDDASRLLRGPKFVQRE